MQKISIRFRCGHVEKLSPAQVAKERNLGAIFTINGQKKAESGSYCYNCFVRAEDERARMD